MHSLGSDCRGGGESSSHPLERQTRRTAGQTRAGLTSHRHSGSSQASVFSKPLRSSANYTPVGHLWADCGLKIARSCPNNRWPPGEQQNITSSGLLENFLPVFHFSPGLSSLCRTSLCPESPGSRSGASGCACGGAS